MTKTVLIAHADADYRAFAEHALTARGYRVRHADGPDAALERCSAEPPDAIVVSMRLARKEDCALIRALTRLRSGRFVPIVVLVDEDQAHLPTCVAAGADDFISRTRESVVLQCRVDGLLRLQSVYRELDAKRAHIEEREAKMVNEQRVAEKLFSRIQSRNVDVPQTIRRMVSPHSVFNGDLLLTAHTPSGATRILLGDFTGHGLVAALGGMPLVDAFHSMTARGFSIPMMVEELNRKLRAVLPTGLFCAAVVFEIDAIDRVLRCWNGGMHSLLVRGPDGGVRLRLSSRHLALGILSDPAFDPSEETQPLHVGERVLAYSDGVVEAGTPEDMFGPARLEALFGGPASHETFLGDLGRQLAEFWGRDGQEDDVTLIDVLFDGVSRAPEPRPSSPNLVPPARWQTTFTLEASALRQPDPVPSILQPVFNLQGLSSHRRNLHTILAELFNNALDHGLLELDSAWKRSPEGFQRYYATRTERLARLEDGHITVRLDHAPREDGGDLTIEVADTGAGFDPDRLRPAEAGALCGRGIPLVRELCESLTYRDHGRVARAVFRWSTGG